MFTPFHGLLFDPRIVSPTSGDTTSPPYDVIDDEERIALADRSPHNVVRLILPDGGEARYQRAATTFAEWRSTGLLRADPEARFYVYEMAYPSPAGGPGGAQRTARGILGALVVEPIGKRVVGHEETMAKHRADRLALLTATEANLDVIVALSSAPDLARLIEPQGPPRLSFDAGGVHHRLFDVTDPERISAIGDTVARHGVAIADGHHRYTTALAYAEERDPEHAGGPWDGILAFLAPAQGSGLSVEPYHRVLASFPFDPASVAASFSVEPTTAKPPDEPGTLVVVSSGSAWLLRARPEALADLPTALRAASTAVAREILYPLLGADEEGARYTPDASRAIAEAPTGGAALLVAPVAEESIALAGEAGIRFPQKSTYFAPKPRAGLVIRAFDIE